MKYFFLILFVIFGFKKTKKNKINYFNFVLYYEIIRLVYLCLKTDFFLFFFIAFHGSFFIQKDRKVAKIWKTCLLFMVAMATGVKE